MKWKNTLAGYEKDIENRGFKDWLRAHTSWLKPLHRYEGTLKLTEEKLSYSGKDVKKEEKIDLEIPLKNIENYHHGFDETFRRREDRQIGLFGFAPLKIKYVTEGENKKIYFFAEFGRFPMRNTENEEVHKKLNELMNTPQEQH